MNNNDEIFQNRLKELHKIIFASENSLIITNMLDSIYNYTISKWSDLDFFKRFDEIINLIFIPRVIKDQSYVDSFLKKYLNIYFELLGTDVYQSWGLVFSKMLQKKYEFYLPLVITYIVKLFSSKQHDSILLEEMDFPINDNISLYKIFQDWLPVFEDEISYSSSYSLFSNVKIRNKLIMYCYNYYKEKNHLNIWFPFSGIGIEPLLFSYIFHLIIETEKGIKNPENISFHTSDHNFDILENGIDSNLFDDVLLKVKQDFCYENGLKTKDIKATIKNAKKKIFYHNLDFIYKSEILEKKTDFIFFNSLKFAKYEEENQKLQKLINKLSHEENSNFKIIYEIKSEFPFNIDNLKLLNILNKNLIESDFISGLRDYHLQFFSFELQKKDIIQKEETFEIFYTNTKNLDETEIKKQIHKIKIENLKKAEILQFAEICANVGFHSKSYEIIKKNYETNFNYSFNILQNILKDCKNQKLKSSIENFIINNQLKEKGFSGELLDAIIEEIEEYFEENPKSILKKEMWL